MSATPSAPLSFRIANVSVSADNASASETLPAATGGDGSYTYSIRSPSNLPTGVSAASNFSTSRRINVSANRSGSFSMTVRVTDGTGATADETFTFAYDTTSQDPIYLNAGTWSGTASFTLSWDGGELGTLLGGMGNADGDGWYMGTGIGIDGFPDHNGMSPLSATLTYSVIVFANPGVTPPSSFETTAFLSVRKQGDINNILASGSSPITMSKSS